MSIKYLITGANGFIGSKIFELLQQDSHNQVFGISRDVCDLEDYNAVEKIVTNINPDVIIHCAWFVKHNEFWTSLENYKHIGIFANILKIAQNVNCKYIIGLGTFAEYLNNINHYISCKRLSQSMLQSFAEIEKMDYLWCRVFNIFGNGEPQQKFISHLISNLREKKEVILQNPYNEFDYIYVDDAAQQIVQAIQAKTTGEIDIGSGFSTRLLDIAQIVCDVLDVSYDLIKINAESTQREQIHAENQLLTYDQKTYLTSRIQQMI